MEQKIEQKVENKLEDSKIKEKKKVVITDQVQIFKPKKKIMVNDEKPLEETLDLSEILNVDESIRDDSFIFE